MINCVNVKYHNAMESLLSDVEIEVLDYLQAIGYSTELRGTYYFKDLIVSIIETILNISMLETKQMEELLENIKNPYSQFYLDLVRKKYDFGISSFNSFIRQDICLDEDEIIGLKAYEIAVKILQNRGTEINIIPLKLKLEKQVV